jgi:hypothetical protein
MNTEINIGMIGKMNNSRTNGPAVIHIDGYKSWWINDKIYCDNKSFQKAAGITDEDMIAIVLKYGNVK